MNLIDKNIKKINDLCFKHKVSTLFVFGSILTNKFKKNSDIDFIVDFFEVDIRYYADNYFSLKSSLQKVLKRNIDLLEQKAIRNPYLIQSINSNKQLVYG